MPKRHFLLVNNEIYHVYNRSIGNTEIFTGKREIERFTELLDFYRFPQKLRFSKYRELSPELKELYLLQARKELPLVSIWAYAIMPDHFHLLIKQLADNGIKTFVSNIQNAYAKYMNIKKKRRGSLFLNPFRAKHIDDDSVLVHVSRYIHLNPVTAYMFEFKNLTVSSLTSFPYYFGRMNKSPELLIDNSFLLERFRGGKAYRDFVANQVDYQRKLGQIKKYVFEKV